jgi:FixJ family two-component response regulator
MKITSPQFDQSMVYPAISQGKPAIFSSDYPVQDTEEVAYLVSDCASLREAFLTILQDAGIAGIAFGTIEEYSEHGRTDQCSCLILDLNSLDEDSLSLQCALAKKACPPVLFVSGHCDIPSVVRVMKAGAIELLTKPVNPAALTSAIRTAFARDRKWRQKKAELTALQERHAHLTSRQRQVLRLVVGGLLNKQSAGVLGISEATLQLHRGQVMRKMQASSFADLVRMAEKLRISTSTHQ